MTPATTPGNVVEYLHCQVCGREIDRRVDAPKLDAEWDGEEMIWFCTEHGSPLIQKFMEDRASGRTVEIGAMIDGKYICYVPLRRTS